MHRLRMMRHGAGAHLPVCYFVCTEHYSAALGRLIYIKRKQEGKLPINQNYLARSTADGAADVHDAQQAVAPGTAWDSSDIDTQVVQPLSAMLQEHRLW